MNMARFTAEASLYKTSTYYRTGRHEIHSSTQLASTVYPAAKMQDGQVIGHEVIEVKGQAPLEFVGLGTWGWGHGSGVPVSPGRSGSGGSPSPSGPRTPTEPPPRYDPSEGGKCKGRAGDRSTLDATYRYDALSDQWWCCNRGGDKYCVVCRDDVKRCQNR